MKNQVDYFQRCFPQQGSTNVVCEHENGKYVIAQADEGAPTTKKRLELTG